MARKWTLSSELKIRPLFAVATTFLVVFTLITLLVTYATFDVQLVSGGNLTRSPVLPLAVRNPYLSLWINSRVEPWKTWPIFWNGDEIGLTVLLKSSSTSTVYPLIGKGEQSLFEDFITHEDGISSGWRGFNVKYPQFKGYTFDAIMTNLSYVVEGVDITIKFTSPITPGSIVEQSLPASYIEVILENAETREFSVYVDVNGKWVSHDSRSRIKWDLVEYAAVQAWKVEREVQLAFTELLDRAEWGTFYLSTRQSSEALAYRSGTARDVRREFAKTGTLSNISDTHFRAINNREPVFAFTKKFPALANSARRKRPKVAQSFLFTVSLVQDSIVQYASKEGYTKMRPLWTFYQNSRKPFPELPMLHDHLMSYEFAVDKSYRFFVRRLEEDSRRLGGEKYKDIVSLSARQVLGATYISGTSRYNPLIFLKEISSNGNFQTVDVIFPSMPFWLYTDPTWLGYLLEPLLDHQMAGLYPNAYSIHDLGAHFPNATGHPDGLDEPMPVEECGNMLIMALAFVHSLISTHGRERGLELAQRWINKDGRYRLWTQWTGYLVEKGLVPAYQFSTDDFAGRLANQTNLAVKALIGIRAMSEIAYILENMDDYEYYQKISSDYLQLWKDFALSPDKSHTKLAYHEPGSWGTLYNLYADSLLCFHVTSFSPTFPVFEDNRPGGYFSSLSNPSIYSLQSRWYSHVITRYPYGLPLDSRHDYTKSDWEFFAASIAAPNTRQMIIDKVGKWLNETSINRPFSDLYEAGGRGGWGGGIRFMARPVVGGHFALLVLEKSCWGKGLDGVASIFANEEMATAGMGLGQEGVQQVVMQGWGEEEGEDRGI